MLIVAPPLNARAERHERVTIWIFHRAQVGGIDLRVPGKYTELRIEQRRIQNNDAMNAAITDGVMNWPSAPRLL